LGAWPLIGHRARVASLRFGLLLFALSLGIYLLNGRFDESPDTFGNELLPVSIIRHQTLTFDQYFADGTLAPGSIPSQFAYRVTPEIPSDGIPWWFARSGGHIVTTYPILPGLLNTPVFWLADVSGVAIDANVVPLTHISTSIIAALSVLFMYLCLVQVCQQRTAVFLTLNFAFATAIWSANSRSLNQHGPAVVFITAGLAALLTRRPRLVALAGFLLSLAVVARPANVVIVAPIALFVLIHERRAFLAFAALAAVPAGLLAWYSWVYWGTPLALGQGQGLGGFTAPEPALAAVGLLVSPNRGLLVFSPIFIFSMALAVFTLRGQVGRPLLKYLIGSGVILYVLYTQWSDWAAGHSYGYRYLIEIVPALFLVLASGWDRLIQPRPYLRALFVVAMAASLYVHGIGAAASPCGFDDEPNNIDFHHERLWDIASGEVARCTAKEVTAWSARLAGDRGSVAQGGQDFVGARGGQAEDAARNASFSIIVN
jgi:hypothetical protein